MKYFLDTEFIEKPNTIELISIGIICEDNRSYYAISSEYNPDNANEWVKENVLSKIAGHPTKSSKEIKSDLSKFITTFGIGDNIEFYGYYSDYDWVVFCWIFGTMMQLPIGFPMYCKDLKQMLDERNLSDEWLIKNCPPPEDEHNALVDAQWNQNLYKKIQQTI